MNMPTPIKVQPETISTPTPQGHEITPRDRRFGRDAQRAGKKYWLNGDPIGTAFYDALSLTFPRGEAYFIESVKEFRDCAPPKLQREIRAFVKQEVIHSREHLALNRRLEERGFDTSRIEERITESLNMTQGRPKIANLASTMTLEHYTAILAKELLANPRHMAGADQEIADLWRWHALEEIEHKGVAYDTWLYATKDWTRWQRWKVKALILYAVTVNFWHNRYTDTLDLLAQDGIKGWQVKLKLLSFLLARPGMGRKMIIPCIKFLLPGFHPWNEDDRRLIDLADSEYEAALLDRHATESLKAA